MGEEVEEQEINNDANVNTNNTALAGSQRTKEKSGIEEQSTVNPNTQEIRVANLQAPTMKHVTWTFRAGNGSPKEARIEENAGREATENELGNGTVNPSLVGQVSSEIADHVRDEDGVGPD